MQAAGVLPFLAGWVLLATCPCLLDGQYNNTRSQVSPTEQGDIVVSTVNGKLRGRREQVTDDNLQVFVFLGVPYAKPPLGDLRFRAPLPYEPWSDIRNASHHGAHCVQNIPGGRQFFHSIPLFMPHEDISEDCLFLNVYTPTLDTTARLAVLFFIHGGGLFCGTGAQYDGRALAALGNIVVVIINYRLDALGFLGTGDEQAPGNVGFLDQISALRWVQNNIHFFGGNPEQVTIAGQSAGGVSVGLLVLSPLTNGLFRRAISESGAAMTMPPLTEISPDMFVHYLRLCLNQAKSETLLCLRNVNVEEIIQVMPRLPWTSPVIDGYFLLDNPTTLLKKGQMHHIDYLMGVTNHEMGYIIPQDNPSLFHISEESKDAIRRKIYGGFNDHFQCEEGDDPSAFISDALLDLYVTEQDPYQQIVGDIVMTVPTANTALYTADADNSVYLYEFKHRPSWHHSKPDHVKADHGDELLFVFGAPFFDWPRNPEDPAWRLNFTEEERVLSRKVLTYWTNFVKTGDPNRRGMDTEVTRDLEKWPRYSREGQAYLQLDSDISAAHCLKARKVRLINDMLTCTTSGGLLGRTWTMTISVYPLVSVLYHGLL